MPRNYEPEFKKKIVRLHLEEGRTYASIREEYGISKSAISSWCNEFSKECQKQADIDNDVKTDLVLWSSIFVTLLTVKIMFFTSVRIVLQKVFYNYYTNAVSHDCM